VDDQQIGTGDGATGGSAEPGVFPFVLGCVRSGTTMLRAMLDSHSALAVPPESYFVALAVALADRYETANGIDREALLQAIVLLQERIQQEGLGNDELRARWRGEPITVG